MNKAILISINPYWLAKILNGEKIIELRKTFPNCDLPIDVYMYCTQGETLQKQCSKIVNGKMYDIHWNTNKNEGGFVGFNGKVVAKFTLRKAEKILPFVVKETKLGSAYELTEEKIMICQKAQLTYDEYNAYLKCKVGYAWYISDLQIFDEPMKLEDFHKVGFDKYYYSDHSHEGYLQWANRVEELIVHRAPQSWQYVEVE